MLAKRTQCGAQHAHETNPTLLRQVGDGIRTQRSVQPPSHGRKPIACLPNCGSETNPLLRQGQSARNEPNLQVRPGRPRALTDGAMCFYTPLTDVNSIFTCPWLGACDMALFAQHLGDQTSTTVRYRQRVRSPQRRNASHGYQTCASSSDCLPW